MNDPDYVNKLNLLIHESSEFEGNRSDTTRQTSWILKTSRLLTEIFGDESMYSVNFKSISWKHRGAGFIGGPIRPLESRDPRRGLQRLAVEANTSALRIARGILQAALDEVDEVGVENINKINGRTEAASDLIELIKLSEINFRKLFREKPSNEKQVQEKYEDLLSANSIAFLREKEAISYSSKSYIPDFTIRNLDLAIELKICADATREKGIIPEINDDIAAYSTRYKNLLFIIYDTGFIRDTEAFKESFEEKPNTIVLIVKH